MPSQWNLVENALLLLRLFCFTKFTFITYKKSRFIIFVFMKANNSLRINMPRALELISFFSSVIVRLIRVRHNEGKLYVLSEKKNKRLMKHFCGLARHCSISANFSLRQLGSYKLSSLHFDST